MQKGPVVLLRHGKWKLDSNVKDTEIHVVACECTYIDGVIVVPEESKFPTAQIVVEKVGTEREISIFAVKE